MKIPRPIPKPDRPVQEDHGVPAGYCLDPFRPLFGAEPSENSDLALSLYEMAIEIDEWGLAGDYIADIHEITHNVRLSIVSWYEVGLKVWKIKLFKAWKKEFSSFKDFCENAIGRTAGAVNNWIRSARVMSQLIAMGFDRLPMNASIALELSKFSAEDLGEAWGGLCAQYADHEMTLMKVQEYLSNPIGKDMIWRNMRVPVEIYERLKRKADRTSQTVNELLEDFLGTEEPEETESETENEEPRYLCDECNTVSLQETVPLGRKEPVGHCDCCGYTDENPNFAVRYHKNFRYEYDYYNPDYYYPNPPAIHQLSDRLPREIPY